MQQSLDKVVPPDISMVCGGDKIMLYLVEFCQEELIQVLVFMRNCLVYDLSNLPY